MEKNNVVHVDKGGGGLPPYALELDYGRGPAARSVPSPTILHISNKRTDRRLHRRYPAARGAFALLRSETAIITDINSMSMGDIAFAVMRSQPAKMGQIVNISMGGLVFQYAQEVQRAIVPSCLDILLADCRYYLDSLNFKMVADIPTPDESDFESVKTKLISVRFENLTVSQKKKLQYFLKNHTRIHS